MEFFNIHNSDYEKIFAFHDPQTSLRTYIAIHSTQLGPAVGGVRMRPYSSENEALADALLHSKSMTYKAAMADLPLGGGKSVIIGDPSQDKSDDLWEAFGHCLDNIGGDYIAAEDMGTTPSDMDAIARVCRFVLGTSTQRDLALYTARGVFEGIKAALLWRYGDENIGGRRIAIQGLGAVGTELAAALAGANAELVVSDIREDQAQEIAMQFNAECVNPKEIHRVKCDVFSPCAMGGVLDERTVKELRCDVVAGSANNQFASPKAAHLLDLRKILYAPDYVINAGGLIGATAATLGLSSAERDEKITSIATRLLRVFLKAERGGIRTNEAADAEAEGIIRKDAEKKSGINRVMNQVVSRPRIHAAAL